MNKKMNLSDIITYIVFLIILILIAFISKLENTEIRKRYDVAQQEKMTLIKEIEQKDEEIKALKNVVESFGIPNNRDTRKEKEIYE